MFPTIGPGLTMAAYADLTLVDIRALENMRRVRAKDAVAGRLLGHVERAAGYSSIPSLLAQA
ncbi:hypothetical protein J2X20_005905 [Pelomonas saccharophila]|uniref:Uncharacterized protein n=1 Tax=Roseateles saccharophilus TaxID=304 RepID=A0ABU1YY83_ROSSA|nr:hypothetical protein [Roseateles saccharophilus]MDR7273215.1 hypothetical protein [Roseateles saccharophilus]